MLISGMLFGLSYYDKLIDNKLTAKDFLLKRLKRIYPLYFVTIIFCVLVEIFLGLYNHEFHIDYWKIFRSLFFFGDSFFANWVESPINYPAWFLCPLFCSHILACIIISLTKKKKSLLWFLIPIVYGIFAYNTKSEQLLGLPLLFSPRNSLYVAYFFIGLFLIKFLQNYYVSNKIKRMSFAFFFFNLFIFFFFYNDNRITVSFGEQTFNFAIWIPLIISLYGTKINLLFNNKFFKNLSNYSIHLWLWHIPFLQFLLAIKYPVIQENRYWMLLYLLLWCLFSYLIQILVPKLYSLFKNEPQKQRI